MDIPADFDGKSNEDVITYLQSKHDQLDSLVDVVKARLMFVGPPESGKTTLAKRLVTGGFVDVDERTDGMELNYWKYKDVDFVLYDFGGQDIYMNTHPILFAERSIFVVICCFDADDESYSMLHSYLQHIRNVCAASVIVLVTTHKEDVNIEEMDADILAMFKEKYGTSSLNPHYGPIDHYFHIGTKANDGVSELMDGIVSIVNSLPYLKASVTNEIYEITRTFSQS